MRNGRVGLLLLRKVQFFLELQALARQPCDGFPVQRPAFPFVGEFLRQPLDLAFGVFEPKKKHLRLARRTHASFLSAIAPESRFLRRRLSGLPKTVEVNIAPILSFSSTTLG